MIRRLLPLVLAPALMTLAPTPSAHAEGDGTYAPLDRHGPRLTVPRQELRDALTCHGDPSTGPQPVLLNPATSVTPEENYGATYVKAFNDQGRAWCWVEMPHHTQGDIQVAGEHLVHAIRTMHHRAGRKIAVLGHSQGGMSMRWALRFWPNTRTMVDDVIGMAPSNHGTTALPECVEGVTTCTPAVWQQRDEAAFIEALNSRAETFSGISYTVIYSRYDEVVTPNHSAATSSSALRTGSGAITNVAVQDVCPASVSEHLLVGVTDPATYALVTDALDHRGPALPARVFSTSLATGCRNIT